MFLLIAPSQLNVQRDGLGLQNVFPFEFSIVLPAEIIAISLKE